MSVISAYFRDLLARFREPDVIVGLVLFLAIFVWELLGVFDGRYLTITDWFKSWMPIWAMAPILAWLCWHFVVSDLHKRDRILGVAFEAAISVILMAAALLQMKLKG